MPIFALRKLAILLIPMIVGGLSVHFAWSSKHSKLLLSIEKSNVEHLEAVRRIESEYRVISSKVEAKYYDIRKSRHKLLSEVENDIENQISSGGGTLGDDNWVRIHNLATPVPRVPDTAEYTFGASSRIQKDPLSVITGNYAQCQRAVDRLEAWQDWYNQIKAHQDVGNE